MLYISLKSVLPFGVMYISADSSHAWATNSFSFLNCNPRYITEPIFRRCSINRAANDFTRHTFFQKASLFALVTASRILVSNTGSIGPSISPAGCNRLRQYLKGSSRNTFEKNTKNTASKSSNFSSFGSCMNLRRNFTLFDDIVLNRFV